MRLKSTAYAGSYRIEKGFYLTWSDLVFEWGYAIFLEDGLWSISLYTKNGDPVEYVESIESIFGKGKLEVGSQGIEGYFWYGENISLRFNYDAIESELCLSLFRSGKPPINYKLSNM